MHKTIFNAKECPKILLRFLLIDETIQCFATFINKEIFQVIT